MKLELGMTVVEVGPGKGNYTFEVAKRVSPDKVYASNISPRIVERLKDKAKL